MNYKILIVDDEEANLRVLERLFRQDYHVISAVSGNDALELLYRHDVALIISDQRMPSMTGIEFLKRSAEMRPHTVRIILTGYTDINTLAEAINSGVIYKYITKPWVNEDLLQTVKRALQHYDTLKSQHELSLQNKRLQERLKTIHESFIRMLIEMLNLKDPSLPEHVHRVRTQALTIGRFLNLEVNELEQLSLAAFLHEVPCISIPNHLLHKKTKLTADEEKIFISCFELGLRLLEDVPDFENVALAIRYQYENYDGSGYPAGLSEEQIPLHSRIIAVANAFDDMTVARSLEPALKPSEAIEQLKSEAGIKYDPELVNVMSKLKSNEHNMELLPV